MINRLSIKILILSLATIICGINASSIEPKPDTDGNEALNLLLYGFRLPPDQERIVEEERIRNEQSHEEAIVENKEAIDYYEKLLKITDIQGPSLFNILCHQTNLTAAQLIHQAKITYLMKKYTEAIEGHCQWTNPCSSCYTDRPTAVNIANCGDIINHCKKISATTCQIQSIQADLAKINYHLVRDRMNRHSEKEHIFKTLREWRSTLDKPEII